MIEFQDVTKSFGSRMVLDEVSFRISPGDFVCITGPSGAGKSTVVNLFIRAQEPTSGKVLIDGKDLHALPRPVLQLYRRRTGVVFQDYKLLSDRTVYENIAFAMEVCGDSNAYIAKRIPALLDRVGLKGRGNAEIHELSGGEKARVSLARALTHHPMVVIADEPTGNIDPEQSLEILRLLQEVNKEGVTVILATHDEELVNALQTRVLRLEDGKIVRDTVGGYHKGDKSADKTNVRSHNLFDSETPTPKKSGKKNGDDSRKIKPIAI